MWGEIEREFAILVCVCVCVYLRNHYITERFDWIFGIIYELPVSFLREIPSIGGNDFHRVYIKIYPRRVRCNRPRAPHFSIFHFEREEDRAIQNRAFWINMHFSHRGIPSMTRWWFRRVNGYRYIFPDIDNPWISWPGDYYPLEFVAFFDAIPLRNEEERDCSFRRGRTPPSKSFAISCSRN